MAKHSAEHRRRKLLIILLCVALVVILPVAAFYTVTFFGKRQLHKGDAHISLPTDLEGEAEYIEDEDVIQVEGRKYALNRNTVSVLCMGVDKKTINENANYGSNGQADCIFLAVIDTKTRGVKILPISRESMVDVDLYSAAGSYLGVERTQLCLAYAYGNSTESSCENVVNSVRRLLYNINISAYIAVDLKGIGVITERIGGVPVTAIETLSGGKNSIVEGQSYNLKGDLAVFYVQNRGQDVEANNRRIARQKQFLSAFATAAGNQVKSDFTKLASYYNTLTPYLATDFSFPEIAYLASRCLTVNFGDAMEYLSVEGETVMGEKYVEFYPDADSLLQNVLEMFYTPVD